MSVLNRPSDGLLSVLLALRRALVAYGPQTEERLVALCAPPSIAPDGKPDMARKTLTRWKQLGMFREVDGKIDVGAGVASVGVDDVDGFRRVLLSLVLDPLSNPAFADERGVAASDDQERTLASDFTRAAAWVLAQDPYSFVPVWSDVQGLQRDQAIEPHPFVNDTRWQGFVEWAAFLGLGWTASRVRLVLDPTFAVRSKLDGVFTGSDELDQATFLSRLADMVPVVDGGRYRLAVESEVRKPWRTLRPDEISPCLSAVLLHLEAAGELRLEARADAPHRTLLGRGGRELRRVSHFVRQRVC